MTPVEVASSGLLVHFQIPAAPVQQESQESQKADFKSLNTFNKSLKNEEYSGSLILNSQK